MDWKSSREKDVIKAYHDSIFSVYFSARDIEPVQPSIPPPLPPSPIPLFNPREIQLGKKHALSSANEQGGNLFRKTANGRD